MGFSGIGCGRHKGEHLYRTDGFQYSGAPSTLTGQSKMKPKPNDCPGCGLRGSLGNQHHEDRGAQQAARGGQSRSIRFSYINLQLGNWQQESAICMGSFFSHYAGKKKCFVKKCDKKKLLWVQLFCFLRLSHNLFSIFLFSHFQF